MMDFILRAFLAGIGVAAVAGPLGSFIVWRRMAYFGDALSHSALLGIALGILLNIHLNVAVIAVCLILALFLVVLQKQQRIATDTLLGILAHTTLSLGIIAVSLMDRVRIDLMSYLFGDLLSVTYIDLAWIYGGGALALTLLYYLWDNLLSISIHEELAQAEGVNVTLNKGLLMLLVAIVIAVAMKIVGVLLITSLLIIPAAAARRLANTPEKMAGFASLIGCIAVALGLTASFFWDIPTGPAIVVSASLLFLLTYSLRTKN